LYDLVKSFMIMIGADSSSSIVKARENYHEDRFLCFAIQQLYSCFSWCTLDCQFFIQGKMFNNMPQKLQQYIKPLGNCCTLFQLSE
jgi:hypothetical protein